MKFDKQTKYTLTFSPNAPADWVASRLAAYPDDADVKTALREIHAEWQAQQREAQGRGPPDS